MSSVAITGGATGTGVITVLAPVTNTNRTLTLPDVTDTVAGIAATQTLTNKTLTSPTLTTPNIDSAQFATVSGTAPIYPCRAWVNFNGTGTVAIRASGNVSSITDNGTADYTVNFTTNMPDINYAWSGGVWNSDGTGRAYIFINNSIASALAVGSIRFLTGATSDFDVTHITISIFR